MQRLIFHVDVNSAFLSWEAAKRVKQGLPDLREIPSCIGGDPKKRTGIVVAKSIPAKKYGIQTGEPMGMALQKCPDLVCVPSDFALYDRCSKAFKSICASYAPVMESFSIDEVFLDMTGTGQIYPDPVVTACEIKDRIYRELGFTVNVGISTNKLLAKMASDFEKPNKVHSLYPEEVPQKMWPLPVRDLLFLGKASEKKLVQNGIRTIGDLARANEKEIQMLLGEKAGHQLYLSANGIDDSPVKAQREEAKGISVETTFDEDIVSYEQIFPILLSQCDIVAARMRREGKKCNCVAVSFRTLEFKNKSHQRKLDNPTDVTNEIYQNVRQLFQESWSGQPLRLIGVALTGLTEDDFIQMSLFEDPKKREQQKKLDEAMDNIRKKFGNDKISRASTMNVSGRIARKAKAQMENGRKKNDEQ
ncbi:DNA polymerase IV [uncultured Clostridium sp.]|uniref:DNA polymerase IV n=1 Tax=Muricoprocola aceti TaxID=2981772 RepID=A0ABT2SPX5_9FIRM|nr:DNA polymerase IV [Muricoprocola aceti]MCU6726557.1 DNA polymerase IV [Muricoprocola aceti]SCH94653.1 DNA polymerase IV [uncultured Clostridium sp.]